MQDGGCGDLRPAAEEVEPSPPPSGGGPSGDRAQSPAKAERTPGEGTKLLQGGNFREGAVAGSRDSGEGGVPVACGFFANIAWFICRAKAEHL
ncbi:hypothetical protein OPV22_026506 [Ensete ventricosum]|uniref:Uncharacterized protein n=1 Tax=Ensete ventricosum TaxID=4639 RepID=A0AAV8QM12_ENSVE|nr:hypothetical protein OPV22_026506 [Ensete ventricosum]